MSRNEELIACLEAEIVKRDARVAELEAQRNAWKARSERRVADIQLLVERHAAEIAALKAHQPSAQEWPKQQCPVTGAVTDVDPADMGVQQPSGVVLPERMVKTETSSDEYDMCADTHNACLDEVARLNPCRAQSVPDVLFDGFAVYSAIDAKARGRTSPENVSDTLDAAVRLIRAAAPSANHCQHRFMHFGDQANRRCAVCCAVEQFANHTEHNLDMVPGAQKKESGNE